MIHYTATGCLAPVLHMFQLEGSVIPKAFGWAFVSCAICIAVNYGGYGDVALQDSIAKTFFSYTFLLSFLVVFRTQSAYSRYWEGASTMYAIQGNLLNAASCMFAFCSNDPSKKDKVDHFQHLIVRLMSLLHCAGLQQIALMDDEAFEVIELSGLSAESVQHLNNHPDDKSLIVLQWIQKLVVEGMAAGVLPIAPPIASRVFQQLGQGVIQLAEAKKIADVPFPFPYTQMVTLLLFGATFLTPVVVGLMIKQVYWAGLLTFVGIFGFWAINYIAAEIEMPFGDDKNDLATAEMQTQFNRSLRVLMKPLTQTPPVFAVSEDADVVVTKCSIGLDSNRGKSVNRTNSGRIQNAVLTAFKTVDSIGSAHRSRSGSSVALEAPLDERRDLSVEDGVFPPGDSGSRNSGSSVPAMSSGFHFHATQKHLPSGCASPAVSSKDAEPNDVIVHLKESGATNTEVSRKAFQSQREVCESIENHLAKVSADIESLSNLAMRISESMGRSFSSTSQTESHRCKRIAGI